MGTTTTSSTQGIRRIDLSPKEALRQQVRTLRRKLAPAWIEKASATIQRNVIASDRFREAKSVGVYLALPHEVQTADIVAACRKAGKRVCIPALKRGYNRYDLCWYDEGEPVHEAAWGLTEPIKPRWAATSDVDLLIIPCVAFDAYGRRLGHGGGFFDRLLADCSAYRLCIAFELQRVTAIPSEPHDIDMNEIITEKAVYKA